MAVAKETMEIYAPIANRLGMGQIKSELEDLSFRFLHAREYEELHKAVDEKMAVSGDVVERIKATLDAEAEGERDRRRGLRPRQVDVLDLVEAAPPGHRHRPALRLPRLPHHHPQRQRLLRGPRHHSSDVASRPRPDQGLHRHAEAELLPVAAHDRGGGEGAAVRGADPHAGDGPHRRAGHRRALEVQGRARRRASRRPELPLAAAGRRVAARDQGPARLPQLAEDRPLSRTRSTPSRRKATCSRFRAARRRSTSRSASTPTSAATASARA